MCVRARKTDSSGPRSVETERLARVIEGGRCRQAEQTVPSFRACQCMQHHERSRRGRSSCF